MKKKRLLSVLMATEMLFTQLFSGATVLAGDPDADPSAAPAADVYGDYVEGEAIICVRDQGSAFSADSVKAEISAAYGISDLSFETIFDKDPAAGLDFSGSAGAADDWSIQYVKSSSMSTAELISALESKSGVVYAQPNYIYKSEPWDEEQIYYTSDGKVFDDLTAYQFAYGAGAGGIDVPDWNKADNLNADGVVVAVLDSGVDHTNPDLEPVMWTEGLSDKYPDLKIFGGNQYGVNTGYINADGKSGNNVSADTGDNVNGHGTHCAGIIAAAWNGEGVSGAANGCKIMAVKNATDARGYSSSATNILGFYYILYAAHDGVNVAAVNCSWGGIAYDIATTQAVEALGEAGVVTCFAAGNESNNIDINSDTAGLMSGVASQICVDSATEDGTRSDFSNYGIRNTDVFSPGSHILSTYPVAMSESFPEIAVSAPAKDGDGKDIVDEFTDENTYFSYEVNSGSGTAAAIDGGALKISGTDLSGNDELSAETMGYAGAGRAVALTISGNALPALADGKEYTLMIDRKADQEMMYMMVYMKTVSGAWDRPAYSYNMTGSYSVEAYPLCGTGLFTGQSFDLENPQIRLVIFNNGSEETLTNAYIDKLWITTADTIPFTFLQGTSMATPAVAGAVAIVAKAFPEDSAYKRASRILASVRKSDKFADICETGGMVNVRNALDESTYTPVLNNVGYTADGKVELSGYFFGEKNNTALTVTQGEKSWSTADGSLTVVSVNTAAADTETVIFERPEGLRRGEIIVTISDSAKPAERQSYTKYMEIGEPAGSVSSDTMYTRIPVPAEVEADIFGTIMETMTAVNGKFIAAGYDQATGDYKNLIYDGEKMQVVTGENALPYSGAITAWNGKAVASDGVDLYIYDPADGSLETKELLAPFHYNEMDGAIDSLYNDGKNLLLFRTEVVYYESAEAYLYAPTEVWLISDPFNGFMKQLGTLNNSYRTPPVIGHNEKADGSVEYYIFGIQGMIEGAFGGESFTIAPEFKSTALTGLLPDDVAVFNAEVNAVAGVAVKDGIFLTGMVSLKDKDAEIQDITADNYFLSYANVAAGFVPLKKKISDTKIYTPAVAAYKGQVIVYAIDTPAGSTESLAALYSIDMETAPAAGDKIIERTTDTSVKVKKIKMDKKKTVSIDYAEKLNCEVTFADSAKTAAVIFESSNDQVLKVDSFTGDIYGIRPGTATVTASCGNKKAKCVVTVKMGDQKDMIFPYQDPDAGDEITVELNSGEVDYWQLMNIYLTGREKISWKTSNKKVVSVKKGFFTAKKGGNAVVTATWTNGSEKKEIKFNVSVNAIEVPKAATGDKAVKLSPEKKSLKLNKGDVKSFSASLKGKVPEDYVVKFTSTNENLLTIDGSNEITPESGKATVSLNAVGAGTVYLVVEGYSKAAPEKINRKVCKLVVNAPAQEIKILGDSSDLLDMDTDTIYMKKGSCTTVYYTLNPIVSTDAPKVSWKAKGGTVSAKNGVITGKKVKKDKSGNYIPSTVTIKAGAVTKEIKVYVTD